MSPKAKTNTERINVFFPKDALDELKTIADEGGQSVSGLVRFVTLNWLYERKTGFGLTRRLPYGFYECKQCGEVLSGHERRCHRCGSIVE